jgi:rubrerythrin
MAKSRRRYIIEDSGLMEEWDTELNYNIDANLLVRSSKVKVNWKCKVCGYKWQTAICNRTYNHTGCPKCANSILIVGEMI